MAGVGESVAPAAAAGGAGGRPGEVLRWSLGGASGGGGWSTWFGRRGGGVDTVGLPSEPEPVTKSDCSKAYFRLFFICCSSVSNCRSGELIRTTAMWVGASSYSVLVGDGGHFAGKTQCPLLAVSTDAILSISFSALW